MAGRGGGGTLWVPFCHKGRGPIDSPPPSPPPTRPRGRCPRSDKQAGDQQSRKGAGTRTVRFVNPGVRPNACLSVKGKNPNLRNHLFYGCLDFSRKRVRTNTPALPIVGSSEPPPRLPGSCVGTSTPPPSQGPHWTVSVQVAHFLEGLRGELLFGNGPNKGAVGGGGN